MWRATISSLLAHRLRLALTALAIVLGTAFVSGTLIYTDTVRASFDSVFGEVTSKADLNVRGISKLDDTSDDFATAAGPVTPKIADRIAEVDGVAGIERNVEGVAQVLDQQGEPIGGQGPPMLGVGAPTVDGLAATQLRTGRYPVDADDVALDAGTARSAGFEVGDTVQIATNGPVEAYEIVGVFGYGDDVDNLGGASVAMFDPDTAFEFYNIEGGYQDVDVLVADGVAATDVQERIGSVIGDDFEVVNSDELAAEAQEAVDSILGVFNTALMVFAGVSLLVGAFIITNTFAIIVAQRTRELALLRAVGASRRQVLGSVLLEALITGLVASLAGVVLGVLVAIGLQSLLTAFDINLPDADLVFTPRTAVVGVSIGVAVTLLSAIPPATRALRVAPVAAMQAVAAPPSKGGGRARTVLGVLLLGSGIGLLGYGLFAAAGFPVVIAGAVALLLGAALLAQFVTRPLLRLLGWPVNRVGIQGSLARENALRNPRRTASTASALMIGVGLVTFALIFGASIRASTTETIDEQFVSDFQVRSQMFQPLSTDITASIADLGEVETVTEMRFGQVGIDDRVVGVSVVEPSALEAAWNLEVTDGSLSRFQRGGLLVNVDTAEELGLAAGDTVEVTFPRTGQQAVPVRAIVESETAGYYLDQETYLEHASDGGALTLYVSLADGVSVTEGRAAIEDATAGFPALNIQDSQELKDEIAGQVDQILGLMGALLALSILIALFGIANTLGLSVFERTRELGLLRAVGAARAQVRSMVRWESVLIAVLGALFGIGVGTVFGWMTVRGLADDGFSTFAFPTMQVVVAVVAAAAAGMLAAIVPARRAARVDMLQALAAE